MQARFVLPNTAKPESHDESREVEDVIGSKKRPFTEPSISKVCATVARSMSTASGSPTSRSIRPFRNAARSIARLYDALHDPKQQAVLTSPTDTGSGGFTHKFFRVARSREDVIGQRDAIAAWARMSYGWLGRTPDYKAALMNTLGANAPYYDKFKDNASAWYKRAQENVLFMNHAIVNPPVDRAKAAEQVKDVFITIQKETDAGVYVSGAKVVATSSALTHYNFLGQNAAMPISDSDLADHVHRADECAGHQAVLPRASYEMMASVMGIALRLSAVVAFRRERCDLRVRQRADTLKTCSCTAILRKLWMFYPQLGFTAGYQLHRLHPARGQARFSGRGHRPGIAHHRRRRISGQSGHVG